MFKDVCQGCHAEQYKEWNNSHHDLAMDKPSAKTVLGNFNEATFTHQGVTSTFFKQNNDFIIRTDGPDVSGRCRRGADPP